MKRRAKQVSRLHSNDPADAAWRARQAHVDADIEGLARDQEGARMIAAMRADGMGPCERIKVLVSHFRANKGRRPAGP